MKIRFPERGRSGRTVAIVKNLEFCYGDQVINLLIGFELRMKKWYILIIGMRTLLVCYFYVLFTRFSSRMQI